MYMEDLDPAIGCEKPGGLPGTSPRSRCCTSRGHPAAVPWAAAQHGLSLRDASLLPQALRPNRSRTVNAVVYAGIAAKLSLPGDPKQPQPPRGVIRTIVVDAPGSGTNPLESAGKHKRSEPRCTSSPHRCSSSSGDARGAGPSARCFRRLLESTRRLHEVDRGVSESSDSRCCSPSATATTLLVCLGDQVRRGGARVLPVVNDVRRFAYPESSSSLRAHYRRIVPRRSGTLPSS